MNLNDISSSNLKSQKNHEEGFFVLELNLHFLKCPKYHKYVKSPKAPCAPALQYNLADNPKIPHCFKQLQVKHKPVSLASGPPLQVSSLTTIENIDH